ncbi:MAG: hypothetical protein J7M38_15450, partial [Armatimonadetes bacterium]|nr:hypothetical protein [Armatimonadota bacterium]
EGAARAVILHGGELAFSQNHEFDPPAVKWRTDRKFDMPDQWHLTAEPLAPSASQRFLTVIEIVRAGGEFASSVEPLSGDGWLGCRIVRGDEEIVAGFAREVMGLDGSLPSVPMRLGEVRAHAFAVAAHLKGGRPQRLVTIGGSRTTAGAVE